MKTDPITRAAQLRARAAQLEAQARVKARKADAHRKIVLGALVMRAGLADLDESVLLGALLTVAAASTVPERVARWREAGQAVLQHPVRTVGGAEGQGAA